MGEVAKMAVTGVTVVTPESTYSVRTVNVFSTNNQPNQADIVCEKFCGSCGSLYLCTKLRERMKKEITARALLTLIREQVFANATPSMVLTMSIVELAGSGLADRSVLGG